MAKNVPVNVANIEDFTKGARDLGIGPDKFGTNASLSQVGAHGEVSDTSDQGNSSGNVVEESVCAGLRERQAHEDDGRNDHDSADGLGRVNLNGIEVAEVRWLLTQYQSDP